MLVPAIKITDFIKAVTNRFNIGFFIDERSRTVDIISFDYVLAKGIKNVNAKFTSKPKVDNRRVTDLNFPLNAPDEWSDHKYNSPKDFYYDINVVEKWRDISAVPANSYKVYFSKADSTYYQVRLVEGVYKTIRLSARNMPCGSGETVEQLSGIPAMYNYVKHISWPMQTEDGTVTYETDIDSPMPRYDGQVRDVNNPAVEFPLMFLFSRGAKDSYIVPALGAPAVLQYPLGNNDIYDSLGYDINGADLCLSWGGSGGLIDKQWTNRVNWEVNRKKKVSGGLTADDLNELIDFSRAYNIEYSNYLINWLEIELSKDHAVITDAELYRL
jgi:hypothetical protein